jgi:alkylhydroperoxidase/carboxymuconolactone decarboxylase family protein YurZ
MSAGAAIAASCEPCLRKIVPQLQEIGATDEEIHGAIYTGQMVKDRPALIMKQVADEIAGTGFSEASNVESCPGDTMVKDDKYKVMMLVAAAAAMAANCEFCLNKVIPDLIELGVSEADMRKAVEVGQFIKDKPANIMKEAAEALTGAKLSGAPTLEGCPPREASKDSAPSTGESPGGGCCG